MKRITLLSILLAVLSLNSYTQSNYKRFEETIDKYLQSSIKLDRTPYNTKVYLNKHEDTTNLEIKQNKAYLTISLKDSIHFNKIIPKLRNTIDTTYDPRLLTAVYWIYKEFILNPGIELQQKRKLINTCLQFSECVYDNVFYELNNLSSPKYFNMEAKSRIKKLLLSDTLNLTEKEIKIKRKEDIHLLNVSTDTISYFLKKYNADSSNLPYHQWVDSTRNKKEFKAYKKDSTDMHYLEWKKQKRIAEIKEKDYNDYTIISSKRAIVSLIANANLKGFIPELEKMYNENSKYKDRIRLVLAKFRYKDFPQKALNHIKQQVKEDKYKIMDYEDKLYYIGTQEAFAYFGGFLKTDMKRDCQPYSDFSDKRKNYGFYVLYNLSIKIKNMPVQKYIEKYFEENTDKDQKLVIGMSFCKVIPYYPDNILDKMYQWMQENKGDYEIKEYERTL